MACGLALRLHAKKWSSSTAKWHWFSGRHNRVPCRRPCNRGKAKSTDPNGPAFDSLLKAQKIELADRFLSAAGKTLAF